MFYTYVLRCGDGDLYVGSACNLRLRITQQRKAACQQLLTACPSRWNITKRADPKPTRACEKSNLRPDSVARTSNVVFTVRGHTAPASLREALRAGVRTLYRACPL